MKLFMRLFYPALCVFIGWIIGSKYAAPPVILNATDRIIVATSDRIKEALAERRENPTSVPEPNRPGEVAPAPVTPTEVILTVDGLAPRVTLCNNSKISNPPMTDSNGYVLAYSPLKKVGGIDMAMMPVKEACISSGFGFRNGKMHKGVDYYSKKGGTIFAVADGQIIEAEYRNDYGFTVLLNHGNGYFTRYAHIKEFTSGVVVGTAVPRGFALGPMGQTSGFAVPIHLHFELLRGDYDNPKKSFGLKPANIYDL